MYMVYIYIISVIYFYLLPSIGLANKSCKTGCIFAICVLSREVWNERKEERKRNRKREGMEEGMRTITRKGIF